MAKPDWPDLLDAGDFPGARAAWAEKFAGHEETLPATWELAEIEERWGDSLFFSAAPGAAPHYHASRGALVPPGSRFSSAEENARRMQAHQRVTGKIYAIDPYGKARDGNHAQPHPNSRLTPRRRPHQPEPPQPSFTERRAAVLQLRQANEWQQTGLARLFQEGGHWCDYDLAAQWREAGRALAASHPAAARLACAWSIHYFERYHRDWTAHLPASRWDSDGGTEMMEVQDLANSLADPSSEAPLPPWIGALLAGDWQAALAATDNRPAEPAFKPLAELLAAVCRAAGREDAARQLLGLPPEAPQNPA